MFTVVGDCNSESTAYLGRLAAGTFQLPKGQEYLQATITRFAQAFPRISLATHGSFGTTAMFDSTWSGSGSLSFSSVTCSRERPRGVGRTATSRSSTRLASRSKTWQSR